MITISDIIGKTRWILEEENPISDNNLLNSAPIDAMIRNFINEAVRSIVLIAPYKLLTVKSHEGEAIPYEGGRKGGGYVPLPEDFLRLVEFKMLAWRTSVYAALTPEQAGSEIYASVRGGFVNPRCVLYDNKIEYYSLPENAPHNVDTFLYVPIEMYSTADEAEISQSEKLFDPICYKIASLVSNAMQEYDKSKILNDYSTYLLSLL